MPMTSFFCSRKANNNKKHFFFLELVIASFLVLSLAFAPAQTKGFELSFLSAPQAKAHTSASLTHTISSALSNTWQSFLKDLKTILSYFSSPAKRSQPPVKVKKSKEPQQIKSILQKKEKSRKQQQENEEENPAVNNALKIVSLNQLPTKEETKKKKETIQTKQTIQIPSTEELKAQIDQLQGKINELEQEIQNQQPVIIKGEKGEPGPQGPPGPPGPPGETKVITIQQSSSSSPSHIFNGFGSFDTLAVSKHLSAGYSLTVGKIATIGSGDASSVLTVNASSSFQKGADITGGNLTVGGTNFVVDPATGDLTTAGDITSNNVTVQGDLIVEGAQTYSGAAAFTANSTDPALFVNQEGTGNIVQFQDNGQDVFTIADGGDLTLSGSISSSATNPLTLTSASGVLTLGSGTNEIINTDQNADLLINPNGTGSVQFHNSQNYIDKNGNLVVAGDITANGGNITTSSSTFNIANATPSSVNIAGAATSVSIGSSSGTTTINNNLSILGNATIAADKSLTLAGGTSFPSSPTEGQLFFRTDTKKLYIYENSKWQQDRTTATKIVAASDSQNKEKADYVCDGTNDEVEIEQAIGDLPSSGGLVYLLEGTYNIGSSIDITKSNVTLTGAGNATKLFLVDGANTNVIVVGDGTNSYEGITISNLQVDGNGGNNSSGSGIEFNKYITYSKVEGVYIHHAKNDGIFLTLSDNNKIVQNRIESNGNYGINIELSNYLIISGNQISSNENGIVLWPSSYSVIKGNVSVSNTYFGIYLYSAVNTIVSANQVKSNNDNGIDLYNARNSIITGNHISGNGGYGIRLWGNNANTNYIAANEISGNTSGSIYDLALATTIQQRDQFEIEQTDTSSSYTALTITQNGTGDIVNLTGNYLTTGKGIYLANQKSVFSGNALELDVAQDQLEYAYFYDGSSYTNYTNEANFKGEKGNYLGGYRLLGDAVDDAFYFGNSTTFDTLNFDIHTPATSATLVWEYCSAIDGSNNCTGWTALTVTDGTNGFTQDGKVTWTDPGSSWLTGKVNSTSAKWLRVRATALTGTPTANYSTISILTGKFISLKNAGDEKLYIDDQGDIHNAQFKKDVWTKLAPIPRYVSYGSSNLLAYTGGDYIFAFNGTEGTPHFYRYSISSNSWVEKTAPPWWKQGNGTSIVYVGGDYIYALRGDVSTDFYRYSISSDSWSAMASIPGAVLDGGSLVYTGGDYIYALQGNGTANFYRYSISNNSWSTMAPVPGIVGDGASLVYTGGDYIYALRGEYTSSFYRYSISNDSWASLASAPAAVGGGGALAYTGGDFIYAFRGNNTADFWRYSISANSWTIMPSAPGTVRWGGSMVYTNDNFIYALRGSVSTPPSYGSTDFWRYSVGSDTGYDKQANSGLMLRGNITAETNVTFASKPTTGDALTITSDTTGTTLTITQNGTGDIVNIKDGSTSVFKISDGGNVTVSEINNTIYVDGTKYTQDSAGIQNAIDDLPSTGGKVILPEGTYNVDRAIDAAIAYDGGVYTDETTAANNTTTDDMTLLPASPAVDDAYYFGYDYRTRKITLNISTAGVGTWTITWEYYNGSSWTALSNVSDGTSGFTASGTNNITYTLPTDWAKTTVNGIEKYFIRARLSSFTSITTQPKGAQAYGHGSIIIDKSYVTLEGVGEASKLYLADGSNVNVIIAGENNTAYDYIVISNLQIDGNKANQTSASNGIYMARYLDNSKIENVYVHSAYSNGIYFYGTGVGGNKNTISKSKIGFNGGSGIYFNGSDINTVVGENHIYSNTGHGIFANEARNLVISNNNIESNTGSGIFFDGSNNNLITGNNIQSNGGNGILLYDRSYKNNIVANNVQSNTFVGIDLDAYGDNNQVVGNIVQYNGRHGILINRGAYYNVVSNNNLINNSQTSNNTYNEISIEEDNTDYSKYNIIKGNIIHCSGTNKAKYGIYEESSNEDYNTITNNTIIGPVSGAIHAQGPHTTVAGNKTSDTSEGLFDISSNTGATQSVLTVTQNGTGDIVNIKDGSTSVFTIKDGGYIGIGTSSPQDTLDIRGDILGPKQDTAVDCDGADANDPRTTGTCSSITDGTTLVAVASSDNLCADSLTNPTCVWTSAGAGADSTLCTADDTLGTIIIGSVATPCAPAAHIQVDSSWAYYEDVTANSAYEAGEDLYIDYAPQTQYFSSGTGNAVFGGDVYAATRSGGAIDVAEWIKVGSSDLDNEGKAILEPGDVLCLDKEEPNKVIACQTPYASSLISVVSTRPHLTMGAEYKGEDAVKMALSGRVPVKVSVENGPIEIGDYLTSSSTRGVAMKATNAGRVLGIAMEPYNKEEVGAITVLINPGWYIGSLTENGTLENTSENNDNNNNSGFIEELKQSLANLGLMIENGVAKVRELVAEKVTVKKLCVEGNDGEQICIDKNQLKELLEQNGIQSQNKESGENKINQESGKADGE